MLSSRFLRSWGRSPVHLVVQAAQYIIAALLLGAHHWHLTEEASRLLHGAWCTMSPMTFFGGGFGRVSVGLQMLLLPMTYGEPILHLRCQATMP